MLIKGTDTIGLKVISINDGKVIDTVSDVIYDPARNQVMAFLIDTGGWFSEAKVILIQDVSSIGPDAVIVQSDAVVHKASEVAQRVASIAKGKNYLTKTKVITEGGVELGAVSDIYFSLPTGLVSELEISQGVIKDVNTGKKMVKISDIITVGEDAIIVKAFTEQKLEAQKEDGHGLKGKVEAGAAASAGFLQNVGEKAQGLATQVKGKAEEITKHPKVQEVTQQFQDQARKIQADIESGHLQEQVKQGFQNTKDGVGDALQQSKTAVASAATQATTKTQDMRKKAALGKYVTINILTLDDQMLAARGDLITAELMDRAESMQVLDKVLNNVSDKPVDIF